MIVKFKKVQLTGFRTVVIDGKKRRQQKTFYQTLNPFNRNAQGHPKTRDEIIQELQDQRDSWIQSEDPRS